MGIFKKEQEEHDDFLNTIPEAPGAQRQMDMPRVPEKQAFPMYKSDMGSIKQEVNRSFVPAKPSMPVPASPMQQRQESPMSSHFTKPIFVRIDNYKAAMEAIQTIKELTTQADQILDELTRIRNEEDKELNKWHTDIQRIKERLLIIDKRLFEQ